MQICIHEFKCTSRLPFWIPASIKAQTIIRASPGICLHPGEDSFKSFMSCCPQTNRNNWLIEFSLCPGGPMKSLLLINHLFDCLFDLLCLLECLFGRWHPARNEMNDLLRCVISIHIGVLFLISVMALMPSLNSLFMLVSLDSKCCTDELNPSWVQVIGAKYLVTPPVW